MGGGTGFCSETRELSGEQSIQEVGRPAGIWSLEERRGLERRLLESSTKMDVVGGTGVGEHPAGHGTSASWGPQEQRVLQGDGK